MTEKKRQTLPTITVVCMIAAVVVTFGVLPDWTGDSGSRGLLLLAPPLLGICGAIAAPFYRSIVPHVRAAWAICSALIGIVSPWILFVAFTLLFGP